MDLHDSVKTMLRAAGVESGDRIGVAVSGGADSTALLHLLAACAPELRIGLHAFHVDHGLRASSSDDARFVERTAAQLGVPCEVMRVEVHRPPRSSPEAAARDARYSALAEAAERTGCRWVATAHTRDDQAETVLLRLIRGSGTGGLAGIPAVSGRYVRPFLGVPREDVRAWLGARGIGWREDATNLDTSYERNWVRNILMPVITERRSGAARAMARTAELSRTDEDYLDARAEELLSVVLVRPDGSSLRAEPLLEAHEAVSSRAVRKALWRLGSQSRAEDVERILGLARAGRGRLELPGGAVVTRVPEGLRLDGATASPRGGPAEAGRPARPTRWWIPWKQAASS